MAAGQIYEKIYNEKQKNPDVTLTSLCKKYGVEYRNYYQWTLRAKKRPPTVLNTPAPKPKAVSQKPDFIIVKVPMSDIVDALHHHKDLVIPNEKVMESIEASFHSSILEKVALLFLQSKRNKTDRDGQSTLDPLEAGSSEG